MIKRPYRWYAVLLPLLLVGYLFLNRPFAYLHVPGTSIFVGEIVLGVGLAETLRTWRSISELLRRSVTARVIIAFIALGAARLAWDISTYGLFAVRDSAIWYYALFAIITANAVRLRTDFLPSLSRQYRMVLPAFLMWSPIAIIASRVGADVAPLMPNSNVSLLALKPGDYAVHTGAALAYLWLVDRPLDDGARRTRIVLSALAGVGILVAGTQNRSGFLAAAIIAVGAAVLSPARARMLVSALGVLTLLIGLALLTDARVPLGDREVSLEQLVENVQSVGGSDERALQGTVEWRKQLWDLAVNDVMSGHALTGLGFGVDLGRRYGYGTEEGLRNPHNSHLTVLTRMGIPGATLWVLVWLAWCWRLVRMARRRTYHGPMEASMTAVWCLLFVTGTLLNAAFDPSLEGPQTGIWLWTVVGIGVVIAIPPARRRRRTGSAHLVARDEETRGLRARRDLTRA